MAGINAGILFNATPISKEQENLLEKAVFEEKAAFAYLDSQQNICFSMPFGPEIVKDLAWHTVYELTTDSGALIKKVHKRQPDKSVCLAEVLQKQAYEDPWGLISATYNFTLANGDIFVTNDGLIFNTKEI